MLLQNCCHNEELQWISNWSQLSTLKKWGLKFTQYWITIYFVLVVFLLCRWYRIMLSMSSILNIHWCDLYIILLHCIIMLMHLCSSHKVTMILSIKTKLFQLFIIRSSKSSYHYFGDKKTKVLGSDLFYWLLRIYIDI